MLSQRVLRGDKNGLTLMEFMVVILVLCVITSALVMTLSVGEKASGIGSAKVDLQSDVKLLVDWIIRDVRQAKIQDLHDNSPTTDYIKFNQWEWNSTSEEQEKTDRYIEYEYDGLSETLTRRTIVDEDITGELNFVDISMSPFYTSYIDETNNDFSNSTLLENRRLTVAIKKSKTVRNIPLDFIMVEEVRIRNE